MSTQDILFLVVVEVGLLIACFAAGTDFERRSRFRLRMVLVCVSVPALLLLTVEARVLHLLSQLASVDLGTVVVFASLIAAPALLFRTPGPSSGPSEEDGDGGIGPGRPPLSPESPPGGAPLPDADQSRVRVRDHASPKDRGVKRQRSREPERKPAPTPPNR